MLTIGAVDECDREKARVVGGDRVVSCSFFGRILDLWSELGMGLKAMHSWMLRLVRLLSLLLIESENKLSKDFCVTLSTKFSRHF